eukprot:gene285-6700_t
MKIFIVCFFIFILSISTEQLAESSNCDGLRWAMNPRSVTLATLQVTGKMKKVSDGDYCLKTLKSPRGSTFNNVSPNPEQNCYPVPCRGSVVHLEPTAVQYKLFLVHDGESIVSYKHDFGIMPNKEKKIKK